LPEILQNEFDVEHDGEKYTFKAPGIKYRFEVGGKAADIRRRAYPEGRVSEQLGTVDWDVNIFSRNCAVLELYLVKSTVPWPYGAEDMAAVDLGKPPRVDFEKFPPGREDTVDAVGAAFVEALARFRKGGNPD
jgi:hypothetical protein